MVTTTGTATAMVATENIGEVLVPAGTVTEIGTEAALGFELESVTSAPAGGAGAFKLTCPDMAPVPPSNCVGDRLSEPTITGFTVTVAVAMDLSYRAVITTGVGVVT